MRSQTGPGPRINSRRMWGLVGRLGCRALSGSCSLDKYMAEPMQDSERSQTSEDVSARERWSAACKRSSALVSSLGALVGALQRHGSARQR